MAIVDRADGSRAVILGAGDVVMGLGQAVGDPTPDRVCFHNALVPGKAGTSLPADTPLAPVEVVIAFTDVSAVDLLIEKLGRLRELMVPS